MAGAGDELAELLWDHGPALRRAAPPPFQPFTCSAAGSSRSHELKRHAAADATKAAAFVSPVPVPTGMHEHDAGAGLGLAGGLPVQDDDDDDAMPPWLHCPDDGDGDTAPLPPEFCAGLLSESEYSGPAATPTPTPAAAKQLQAPSAAEGVVNFTFSSRPLQRPQPPSHVPHAAVEAATNRLRGTPLFSEQRMAWLQPPTNKAPPRTTPLPEAPAAPPDHIHRRCRGAEEPATVTTRTPHGLPPEAAAAGGPPDAAAAVTTSSVCSGNGDRSQGKRSSSHQPADCSVSQDEDLDDEGGAMRRSAARSSKRSRTAEVHNLSERRRRDRINEKMRALQELIPNCNKVDKASMLEEAIEYLKALQLQVQMMMMSMGTAGLCVPPPMLLPAAMATVAHPMAHAHFSRHLAMGLGFGAHFPCPPVAMPPAPGAAVFGVPGQHPVPSPAAMFAHMLAAGAGAGAAPPEQLETTAAATDAAPARRGAEHPPPRAAAHAQGDQKLPRP